MSLELCPVLDAPELLAPSVTDAVAALDPAVAAQLSVAPIDASLADTAAFCEAYGISLDASANCIVVAGKRGDTVTYAACVVLATTRADVNGVVRKLLGARKISFAPMEEATSLTGMEFGGITPVGLPSDWRIFVDSRVRCRRRDHRCGGACGEDFIARSDPRVIPGVEVIEDLARPIG